MKIILMTIITMLGLHHNAFASPSSPYEQWSNCQQNSDCVVTRAPCGTVGVHRQYLKDAEAYWREVAPRVECSSPGPTDISQIKTICDYQSTSCPKRNWFGIKTGGVDPTSTCMSTEKKCLILP